MAESFGSQHVYAEEWATIVQARLSEPTKFKELCRVEYTNFRVFNNPYLTDPTVQVGTRGSSYTMQEIVESNETVTVNQYRNLAQFIDRANLAQSTFLTQMEAADRQAVLLNEVIEAAVYADYGNLTLFDNAKLGGSAGSITLSATNVDDVIRGIQREIRLAGGEQLLERNGGFIVWRPADFEILQQLMQSTGFVVADRALQAQGSVQGTPYMGLTHYSSNLLSGGHIYAGVKKLHHVAILRDTYGQIMVNEKDPGQVSGVSIVSRVDYGIKAWTKVKPVLFNVTLV